MRPNHFLLLSSRFIIVVGLKYNSTYVFYDCCGVNYLFYERESPAGAFHQKLFSPEDSRSPPKGSVFELLHFAPFPFPLSTSNTYVEHSVETISDYFLVTTFIVVLYEQRMGQCVCALHHNLSFFVFIVFIVL